jgi:hypothetical protein
MLVTPNQLEHLGSYAAGEFSYHDIERERKAHEHGEQATALYDPRNDVPTPDEITSSEAQIHYPEGPVLNDKQ